MPRLAGFLLALLLPALAVAADTPPATVERVDLDRYLGTWYEIARMEHRFQASCAGEVTATYSRQDEGVRVINRCVKEDGEAVSVDGHARIVDAASNAKLEVSFFSIFGWSPFWGDYWVLALDPEYRWAVVGTPGRDYGWILARTPSLAVDDRARIDAALRRAGYDPGLFKPTRQRTSP